MIMYTYMIYILIFINLIYKTEKEKKIHNLVHLIEKYLLYSFKDVKIQYLQ